MKVVGPYEIGETLGEGEFAIVKLARHIETDRQYAVKIIKKELIAQRKLLVRLRREITIMKLVDHRNIVGLHDVFASPTKVFLVLELCEGGELYERVLAEGRLSDEEARDYFVQLIDALDYCHQQQVAHRDLKPENLLLDRELNLKIADFGLSAIQEGAGGGSKEVIHTPEASFYTTCGSPNYASPEVIVVQDKGYNPYMADVWSCGVILFVLLTGYMPFDDTTLSELFRKIMNASFEIPDHISDSAKALIRGILTADVNSRLTIADIRKSKWFNEGQSDGKKRHHPNSSSLAPVLGTEKFHRELSRSAFWETFADGNGTSKVATATATRNGSSLTPTTTTTVKRDYTTGSFISVDGKEDEYDDDEEEIGNEPISMTVFDVVAMVAGASLSRMFHGAPSGTAAGAIRAYTQFSTNVPATQALLELAEAFSDMGVKHQVVNGKFVIKAVIGRARLNKLLQHESSSSPSTPSGDLADRKETFASRFKPGGGGGRKFADKEIRISLQIFALANTTIVACHRRKGTTAAYYAFWKYLKKVLKQRNNLFASVSPRSDDGKKRLKRGRNSRMNSAERASAQGAEAADGDGGDRTTPLPTRAPTLLSEEEHKDPVRTSVFAPTLEVASEAAASARKPPVES